REGRHSKLGREGGVHFWTPVGLQSDTSGGLLVCNSLRGLVGLPGFEPGTSCTPSKRASQAAPQPESLSYNYSYFPACAAASTLAWALYIASKASAGSTSTCGLASCSWARRRSSRALATSISSAFSTSCASTRTLSGSTSTKPPCSEK